MFMSCDTLPPPLGCHIVQTVGQRSVESGRNANHLQTNSKAAPYMNSTPVNGDRP